MHDAAMLLRRAQVARILEGDPGMPGLEHHGQHTPPQVDGAALTEIVDPAEIEAVLVPGLAWDRRGGRLGRGAGYYDRLFAHEAWRGFRCGVFFGFQEVPAVPTEPWDVPLHAVVTDREVWRGD